MSGGLGGCASCDGSPIPCFRSCTSCFHCSLNLDSSSESSKVSTCMSQGGGRWGNEG